MSKRGENIYKRKDGRWEGRILDENGRYKYFYDRNYNEVKRKMKDWLKGNRCVSTHQKNICFSEALERWLKNCHGYVKASTYENYYYSMQKYILPYFRRYKVERITDLQVKDFVRHICNNTSLSRCYQRKILQIFKTALKRILYDDENTATIINALALPRTLYTLKPVEVFSASEQSRIEERLLINEGKKDIGLFICFYTGIRLGELCALRWDSIDLESKTMTISQTLIRIRNFEAEGPKTKLILSSPKSRSSTRKIPLPDFLCGMLHGQMLQAKSKEDYILSNSSMPVDPRTFQRYYERILASAGVYHRKFHAIRHTFATRALEVGIDVRTLSEILGHSGITSTLNTYAHSLLEQKRLAISKMNTLHTNKMSTLSVLSSVRAVNSSRQ